MIKIVLGDGAISEYKGDAIISFCDSDISFRKNNFILELLKYPDQEGYKKLIKSKLFGNEKEGSDKLLKELSAISYVNIGNAVITKAYDLSVNNLIFVPFTDHEDDNNHINSVLLHQGLRSAFTLATLYGVKNLAISPLKIRIPKQEFIYKVINGFFENKPRKALTPEEIFNIIVTITKEFSNQSLEEVVIYR